MKNIKSFYFLLLLFMLSSCSEKKQEDKKTVKNEPLLVLPFQKMALNDKGQFKEAAKNWKIAGSVFADRSKQNTLESIEGTGVLVYLPEEGKTENLFTSFEHGDIELELDVMMPKGSNSGIYFQSRYEVQLFDSWGVKDARYSDMGGIYERWDASKEKGIEGYEGHAPKLNAAKAPGLWQHLKVIFHAPRFDDSGTKTKNAWFEEIWLNGVLLHENIELTGPTKSSAFEDEQAEGPLMIEGNDGPVAIKNIRYKRYYEKAISFKNLVLQEYENKSKEFPNLDSISVIAETKVDAIDLATVANNNFQKLFKYSGSMIVPDSGDYLFDLKVDGGAALLINSDTLINMNGKYNRDSLRLGTVTLEKGEVPFSLIYNKYNPWRRYCELFVEGPGMQKYSFQKEILKKKKEEVKQDFSIKVESEPTAQRSFWMHEGMKRTHCISIGMPEGIHYTYDLETGSLLQVWGGDFMDATKMWLSRGEKQLGEPEGFIVSLHGDFEFASLENDDSSWPENPNENMGFKQEGYEFDADGMPIFSYQINGSIVANRMIPSDAERSLKRMITVDGVHEIWYKVADGEQIQKLPDGTFIVNDESYYIAFSDDLDLKPVIRSIGGKDELIVKIPAGKQNINYNIIW